MHSRQEREDHPVLNKELAMPKLIQNDSYRQPLSVIGLAVTEKCCKRVVPRNDESGEIGKDLATEVEENEREVNTWDQSQHLSTNKVEENAAGNLGVLNQSYLLSPEPNMPLGYWSFSRCYLSSDTCPTTRDISF